MTQHTPSSLERASGRLMVVGFPDTAPPASLIQDIASGLVSGVILFRRNIEDVEQVVELCADLRRRAPADSPLMVSIDQEGGRVLRLPEPWTQWPEARAVGSTGDPDLAQRVGRAMGLEMSACGINLDFAPVLDVHTNPANPIIGDRSFGSDPDHVARMGLALARGLGEAGVMPCGKHFPGHGDTSLDSHLALPVVEHDPDRLESVELKPFKLTAPHLPMIMTAHVLFKAWDSENPATLSKVILRDRLRGDCGFQGVVITDDLMMKAVSTRYPPGELAVRAIEAGVGLLLVCNDLDAAGKARRAVIDRANADPNFARRVMESAERVDALKKNIPEWTPDLSKARAMVGCAEHRGLAEEIKG